MLAVFGGSFDPPHHAHLQVIHMVLDGALADHVLVVPCVRHAFNKSLTPFHHRLEMSRLLCEQAGEGASVSDVEQRRSLSGYTIDTLEALSREYADDGLRLVVGSDILAETDRWHRFPDVERLAPLIVVQRAGHPVGAWDVPAPMDVSSTEIRRLIAGGGGPGDLLCEAVWRYIVRNGLYRE